jgi:hypothetical protein
MGIRQQSMAGCFFPFGRSVENPNLNALKIRTNGFAVCMANQNLCAMKKSIVYLLAFMVGFSTWSNAQEDAFLGVHSNSIHKKKAKILGFDHSEGAYLTSIVPGTAAARMDMRPFDYLMEINGRAFSESWNFHDAMDELKPDEKASFGFIRQGQKMEKTAVLGTRSESKPTDRSDEEDPFLGVSSLPATNTPEKDGVPVAVVDCSTAEKMGLQDGDLITRIDDFPILDWHDMAAAINFREVGDPIRIQFYRKGKQEERTATIQSEAATRNKEDCAEEPLITPEPETEDLVSLAAELPAVEEITIVEVTEREAEEMKEETGVDMPVVNDLRIERLNVFPNPNYGIFSLQFDLPDSGPTQVRIFTSSARVVYENQMRNFSGFFNDQVDLTNRAKGTYFLEIRQNDKTITRKVLIQ